MTVTQDDLKPLPNDDAVGRVRPIVARLRTLAAEREMILTWSWPEIGSLLTEAANRLERAEGGRNEAQAPPWTVRNNPVETDPQGDAFDVMWPNGEWTTIIAVGPEDARDCAREEWAAKLAQEARYTAPPAPTDHREKAIAPGVGGVWGWQPIERAPRDGTSMLLAFDSGAVEKARWGLSRGESAFLISRPDGPRYPDDEPTYWMPLPEAPR